VTQDTEGRYAWAPDGRRLVYAAFDPNALLIVSAADATKRVLRGTRRVGARQPDWSPDGRLIAFLRQRAPYGGSDIYVVSPDGTGLRRLVRTRSDLQTPRWSPDGRSIAYFRLVDDTPGEEKWAVVVADADGGRPRRLGVTHTWDCLDWSPDSKGVLWINFFTVVVANADGSGRPRLLAKGETPDWG
jgi:TolB protein